MALSSSDMKPCTSLRNTPACLNVADEPRVAGDVHQRQQQRGDADLFQRGGDLFVGRRERLAGIGIVRHTGVLSPIGNYATRSSVIADLTILSAPSPIKARLTRGNDRGVILASCPDRHPPRTAQRGAVRPAQADPPLVASGAAPIDRVAARRQRRRRGADPGVRRRRAAVPAGRDHRGHAGPVVDSRRWLRARHRRPGRPAVPPVRQDAGHHGGLRRLPAGPRVPLPRRRSKTATPR